MGFSQGTKGAAVAQRAIHPVDAIEQFAESHGWNFERGAQDEISVSVSGSAAEYHITFSWLEEHETLHLSCRFHLNVPKARIAELTRLLTLANENLLFGHFDYWRQAAEILYRQTLLLSGGLYPTDAQIKTLLMTALDACEAYYGACLNVAAADIAADEALRHALFETMGNA